MKRIELSLVGLVMALLLAAPAYAQSPAVDQYGQPLTDEVIRALPGDPLAASPGDPPPAGGDELDDGAAGEGPGSGARPDDDLLGAPASVDVAAAGAAGGGRGDPIAVAAAPDPAADSSGGGLPFTGSSALLIALVGLALLAAGMSTAAIMRGRERLRQRAG